MLSFVIGLTFGFALEKSKVHLPFIIVSQMKLQTFTMMQTFLTAMVSSLAVVNITEKFGLFKRSPKSCVSVGSFKSAGNIIGGLMIGWVYCYAQCKI